MKGKGSATCHEGAGEGCRPCGMRVGGCRGGQHVMREQGRASWEGIMPGGGIGGQSAMSEGAGKGSMSGG